MAQRHQRGWLKKEKRLKAKLGFYSFALLENLMANGWKTKSLLVWSDSLPRQAVHGPRSNDSVFLSTGSMCDAD